VVAYTPKRGDIVWLEFNPLKGKEIQKTRPAIVISPYEYNKKTGLALFMPITSQVKGYPFECVLENTEIQGAVLCDQVRSLDWKARQARFITAVAAEQWNEVIEKFSILLE
jgi:mRNA interferase MazF